MYSIYLGEVNYFNLMLMPFFLDFLSFNLMKMYIFTF